MLTEAHRLRLREPPYSIHVWHVEQHEGEAVFIPAGCPHQARAVSGSRWRRIPAGGALQD